MISEPFGQEHKVEIIPLIVLPLLRTRPTSWKWGLEVSELPNMKAVPLVAEGVQQTLEHWKL